jgi:hypothetical protein
MVSFTLRPLYSQYPVDNRMGVSLKFAGSILPLPGLELRLLYPDLHFCSTAAKILDNVHKAKWEGDDE